MFQSSRFKKQRNSWMRFRLWVYNSRGEIAGRRGYAWRIIKSSISGLVMAVVAITLLILIDNYSRRLFGWLENFHEGTLGNFFYNVFKEIGDLFYIVDMDRLSDVVSLSAGILGVLLGLFYTVFLTIISTKYSNVDLQISTLFMKRKSLNRYFVWLSVMTSLSILYHFSLSFGHKPTIMAFSVYTIFVVISIASFVRYGLIFMIYLDLSVLASELIDESLSGFHKIVRHKERISKLEEGRNELFSINSNLDNISLIVKESENPQLRNTSITSIFKDLNRFAVSYTKFKRVIPSKGWHIQMQRFRSWTDSRGHNEYGLLQSTGVSLFPENYESYNFIEKKVIEIQFNALESFPPLDKRCLEIQDKQYEFLQVYTHQCDIDLIKHFFQYSEKLSLSRIEQLKGADNQIDRLLHIAVIQQQWNSLILGFSHNITLFSIERLRSLGVKVHEGSGEENVFEFPYYLRVWIDEYRDKLEKEKYLNGEIVTPLFYTNLELILKCKSAFEEYLLELIKFASDFFKNYIQKLNESTLLLEALSLSSWSVEIVKKFERCISVTSDKIIELNDLNFQKSEEVKFDKSDTINERNTELRNLFLDTMWKNCESAIGFESEQIADLPGTIYNFLLQNLVDDFCSEEINLSRVSSNLVRFTSLNIHYSASIRKKIQENGVSDGREIASKLYPIVKDLFDIQSIAIIVGKLIEAPLIEEVLFAQWNQFNLNDDEELAFWDHYRAVYTIGSHPTFIFANNSYEKEHARRRQFVDYIKNHSKVSSEKVKSDPLGIYSKHFTIKSDDIYLKSLVRQLDGNRPHSSMIDIHEIFIEYFLKTRISLKTLDFQNTRYGRSIEREME